MSNGGRIFVCFYHYLIWGGGGMLIFCLGVVHAGDIRVSIVDQSSIPIVDAYVELVAQNGSGRAEPKDGIIDQIDKEFVPLVSAMPVGSTVHFPNSDNIQHQIYSFSKTKTFELPLFAKNDTQKVLFSSPGIVHMGCNIHDWMLSYLYVYESKWFMQTDTKGSVDFSELPEGTYTLRVWSPRLKNNRDAVESTITIGETDNPAVSQTIKIRKEIRRLPRKESGGY